MSLQQGNLYAQQEQYELAIQEWRKVESNSPMYQFAQQNIERAIRLGFVSDTTKEDSTPKVTASTTLTQSTTNLTQANSIDNIPLLSIVMPVYNVAPYLDASILSVLSQTFKDFELIIVNDASTDNSKKIIEMFAKMDQRIRAIHLDINTLGGAGIPSNIGIQNARGKYLGFVDSDDFITNDAFEVLVSLAEQHSAELVIGDFVTFDETSRNVKSAYDGGKWHNMPLNQVINIEKRPLLYHLAPVPWRKLYRMDFMKKHNLLYPEGDYFFEDNPLHWNVLTKASRVVVTKKIISYHRMGRQGQTMSSDKYKLSAVCAHLNTVFNVAKNDSREVVFDEFYDQWHRTDYIVDQQIKDSFEQKIIKKRLANMYHRALAIQPLRTKRTTFPARVEDYTKAYPDIDLNIVISTYTDDASLKNCINSVIGLSDIRFNILVVDNGLNNNSSKILAEYQKQHKNIHCVQQKYRGNGRSRNSLIPMCTGKYVLFLNETSSLKKDALLKAYKKAIQTNSDILFVKNQVETLDNGIILNSGTENENLWQVKNDKDKALKMNYAVDNKLIKAEFLHDNNIFFGGGRYFDEILFHWHCLMLANTVDFYDEITVKKQQIVIKKSIPNSEGVEYKALCHELNTVKKLLMVNNLMNQMPIFKEIASELMKNIEDAIPIDSQADFYQKRRELLQ